MEILVDNKYIYFKTDDKELVQEIRRHFTFKDLSEAIGAGGFNKNKIKNVCMVKKLKEVYYLNNGYSKDLIFFVRENNIKVDSFTDKRTRFDFQKKEWSDEELKQYLPNYDYTDHQTRILRALLKSSVGIGKATTGAGKSKIIAALMKITKLKTLVLVNQISLGDQLMKDFVKDGIDCGFCSGKGFKDGKDAVVSTIGSVKKIPNLTDYKVLISDEVHCNSSNTYQDFLDSFSPPIKWGLSATPEGNTEFKWQLVRKHFGEIVEEAKATELMDAGVIMRPDITFIKNNVDPTLDWQSAYEKCIVSNENRNKIIQHLVELHDEPTLILITNIEHGKTLNKMIQGSVFISGNATLEQRNKVIDDLENKRVKFVISSNIFNQGISINIIKVLVIASGRKAETETLQKIGRITRNHEEKDRAIVYDFMDVGNRFTQEHAKQRAKHYLNTGFKIKTQDIET